MNARAEDTLLQCLLALCRYHGNASTPEALTSGLPLEEGRLTPSLFDRAASRAGLVTRIVRRPVAEIEPALLPVVLLGEQAKACLLMAIRSTEQGDFAQVVYPDINDAAVEVPLVDLQESYGDKAIVCRPRFRFDGRAPKEAENKRGHWFWDVVKDNIPVYRDVLIAAFFINLFSLTFPLFIRVVYDRVLPNHAVETLWMIAAGVVILFVAETILRSMRSYFVDLAARRVDIRASSSIFEHVLGGRLEYRPLSVGAQAVRIRGFESVRDFIASGSVTALIDLPFVLLYIAVLGWLAWQMLIPVAVGVFIVVGYAFLIQGKLRELAGTAYRSTTLRNATLIEGLVGLETLKSMGAESRIQRKWEENSAFSAHVGLQLRMVSNSSLDLTRFTERMVRLSIIIIGVYLIAQGSLSFGGLIACNLIGGRAMSPFGKVAGLLVQYQNSKVALENLDEMMDQPVERPPGANFLSREAFQGEIEFRNVSFSYPGSQIESLRNVSFRIKPGQKVALLGRVGSGKSTIEKLVMGLYQPTEGAILIDGIDLRQLDPGELRGRIGYVPQDVTLFYGTLRENLTLSHVEVGDAAILRAAKMSGLLDLVNRHPKGFDMTIEERGDSISGGQRKSVALARALVHEPNILIMDEPTGSMDHSTENHVKRHLEEFIEGRTMMVVTHRNSLLEIVDRVIVIDNGALVADGPKEQVVQALQQGKIGKAR